MEHDDSKLDRLYWDDEWEQTPKKRRSGKGGKPKPKWSDRLLIPDCRHWRQRFDLEDGLYVFASAWGDRPHSDRLEVDDGFDGDPDIALYLDGRWAEDAVLATPGMRAPFLDRRDDRPSSQVIVWPWKDYGLPRQPARFKRMIRWLIAEIDQGLTVEIGCLGGHGRTGTTLACLLLAQGSASTQQAVVRVRSRYCEEAIESHRQINFVKRFIA